MLSSISLAKVLGRDCVTGRGQRWAHEYAPAAVKAHLDMVQRHVDSFPGTYQTLDDSLTTPEAQSAMENFERITGIEQEDTRLFLSFAPKIHLEEWIQRLLTWKDVRSGKDIFIEGLGKFDANQELENQILLYRKRFALHVLCQFKIQCLRRKCKELKIHTGDLKSQQDILSSILDLDLASFWLKEGLHRKAKHCKDHGRVLFHNRDTNFFGQCILSGGVMIDSSDKGHVSTPFWLPSVGDLRARGYFGNIKDRNGQAFLRSMMSLPEDSYQRQHLLHFRKYWNSPDTLNHLIKLKEEFAKSGWYLPGDSLLPPKQLVQILSRNTVDPPYRYLSTLQDQEGEGIRFLRSSDQIRQVGLELGNCLRHTQNHSTPTTNFFVCLENENKHAMAVGQYALNCNSNPWKRIEENQGKYPSEATLAAFAAFDEKVIRPWKLERLKILCENLATFHSELDKELDGAELEKKNKLLRSEMNQVIRVLKGL